MSSTGRPRNDVPPSAPHSTANVATKGRCVAVTGASGFLGSNLIGMLEHDDRVRRIVAIDLKSAPLETGGEKTRLYEVDLTQPASEARVAEILADEQVDTLAHLAFLSSPTHATAWAHELESLGTMHVTVAAAHARVKKFVLWSLTWLYGARPSNPNFITEGAPLRAPASEPFFADKIAAEEQAAKLAQRAPEMVVTVLRTAPILGPTVNNAVAAYLARKVVPTMMGFDPMVQFLHEADAIAAVHLAVMRDAPGVFNIVGDGVVPLSMAIRLAGRVTAPFPHPVAESLTGLGWVAQLVEAPPSFLKYLRFLCVADGRKARAEMGFRPAYSTREAVVDFARAQRLRDVKLLSERTA
ncbi:MAG TPA: NAD-dependent epimerase/dehydratase family protein [Polyangiaceae bacterium]|jgi:UDP-glucose 4-epimerase|nr:NAD-dependent epimerase/dehydratase family protein [Polyangiaceae bacterium]